MLTSVSAGRKTTHPKQAKETSEFWAVALLVAIFLSLLKLALRSEDFAQVLQLIGQWS
ncbi:MAG TPA: hypothetical protein VM822_28030 [Pseudolabrys sp.]|jgi:hypothetical protein|nr:hypothetical protein [Pseudolabrys sp.]